MIGPAFAEELRDIKPPVNFATNIAFWLIIAVILAIVGLFFLIKYLRKRLKAAVKQKLTPPKSADQIAQESLLALQAQNLPAQGKFKQYYFRLSDIVRRYIENRFTIKAPEMTSEEFLNYLRDSEILSSKHKNLLKDFLNLSDIVKFAKYGPSLKETEQSFQAAVRLVEETKQVPERKPSR